MPGTDADVLRGEALTEALRAGRSISESGGSLPPDMALRLIDTLASIRVSGSEWSSDGELFLKLAQALVWEGHVTDEDRVSVEFKGDTEIGEAQMVVRFLAPSAFQGRVICLSVEEGDDSVTGPVSVDAGLVDRSGGPTHAGH